MASLAPDSEPASVQNYNDNVAKLLDLGFNFNEVLDALATSKGNFDEALDSLGLKSQKETYYYDDPQQHLYEDDLEFPINYENEPPVRNLPVKEIGVGGFQKMPDVSDEDDELNLLKIRNEELSFIYEENKKEEEKKPNKFDLRNANAQKKYKEKRNGREDKAADHIFPVVLGNYLAQNIPLSEEQFKELKDVMNHDDNFRMLSHFEEPRTNIDWGNCAKKIKNAYDNNDVEFLNNLKENDKTKYRKYVYFLSRTFKQANNNIIPKLEDKFPEFIDNARNFFFFFKDHIDYGHQKKGTRHYAPNAMRGWKGVKEMQKELEKKEKNKEVEKKEKNKEVNVSPNSKKMNVDYSKKKKAESMKKADEKLKNQLIANDWNRFQNKMKAQGLTREEMRELYIKEKEREKQMPKQQHNNARQKPKKMEEKRKTGQNLNKKNEYNVFEDEKKGTGYGKGNNGVNLKQNIKKKPQNAVNNNREKYSVSLKNLKPSSNQQAKKMSTIHTLSSANSSSQRNQKVNKEVNNNKSTGGARLNKSAFESSASPDNAPSASRNSWNEFQHVHRGKGLSKKELSDMYQQGKGSYNYSSSKKNNIYDDNIFDSYNKNYSEPSASTSSSRNSWNEFQNAHGGQGLSKNEMSNLYREERSSNSSYDIYDNYSAPSVSSYSSGNSWNDFQRAHGGQGLSKKEMSNLYKASKK